TQRDQENAQEINPGVVGPKNSPDYPESCARVTWVSDDAIDSLSKQPAGSSFRNFRHSSKCGEIHVMPIGALNRQRGETEKKSGDDQNPVRPEIRTDEVMAEPVEQSRQTNHR